MADERQGELFFFTSPLSLPGALHTGPEESSKNWTLFMLGEEKLSITLHLLSWPLGGHDREGHGLLDRPGPFKDLFVV